jgi:hypothetical protein
MKLYVKVLGINPTDIEKLLILGYISVSLEKFDDAEVFYNRVLELEPFNMDAGKGLDQLGKGKMLEAKGQVFEGRYQRTFRI